MNRTLYIDIDSTIWPAEVEYDRSAMELFGKPFGKDWYAHEELMEKFGPDYRQIFRHALDPRRIPHRSLYPGVPWALYVLRGQGFHLHFISHNDHDLEEPIKLWLQDQIMMPFDITVRSVDEMNKVDFMADDPYACGIIEDKSDTLIAAAEAGYLTIAKRQAWNELTLVHRYDILSFASWSEVPELIRRWMYIREEVELNIG